MSLTGVNNNGEKPMLKNPGMIALYLLMAGIVMFFLSLSYGYILNMGENWKEFRLPRVFWLSTICVIMVSVLLRKTLKLYDADNTESLRKNTAGALLFSVLFVVCQVIGWQQLKAQQMLLQTSPSGSYVYLLTGIHVLHVGVGLLLLLVTNIRLYRHTSDNLKALLYYTDPIRRNRLSMLCTYWHTIDFLWIFLFLAFLYNHT
jgi:cytochrome c oxidase subunit III